MCVVYLTWEISQHFATLPLVSPRNDVWETSAEIPYWWRVTNHVWVVSLIGRTAREICFNQSKYSLRTADAFPVVAFLPLKNSVCEEKRRPEMRLLFVGYQKYYSYLGNDTWPVWNFCADFSDVISRRYQWWRRQMAAVFLGYVYHVINLEVKLRHKEHNTELAL